MSFETLVSQYADNLQVNETATVIEEDFTLVAENVRIHFPPPLIQFY